MLMPNVSSVLYGLGICAAEKSQDIRMIFAEEINGTPKAAQFAVNVFDREEML